MMELTLLFKLGDTIYGLEIDAIQEIIENPDQHFVPRAEGVLTGAINFHGRILAVIDLPALLGFDSAGALDHRCVVLTPEHRSLTLQVTGIERIVKLDLAELQPASVDAYSNAIRGVAEFDETMVNMLDSKAVIQQLETLYKG